MYLQKILILGLALTGVTSKSLDNSENYEGQLTAQEETNFWDRELRDSVKHHPVKLYQLSVENGSPDGEYPEGEKIHLRAHCGEKHFEKWVVESGNPHIYNVKFSKTTLVMPEEDVVVSAKCVVHEYELTVNHGTPEGTFTEDDEIIIRADCGKKEFEKWVVNEGNPIIGNTKLATTTLIMPGKDVEITAECADREYELTVNNGTPDGNFVEDDQVTIKANCGTDKVFEKWIVISGSPSIKNKNSATTILFMPGRDVEISAQCEDRAYELIVQFGSGDGTYEGGEQVEIKGTTIPGLDFMGWEVTSGNPKIEDSLSLFTTLTMPDEDVIVRAMFEKTPEPVKFDLDVVNGSGDGRYVMSTEVSIKADCDKNLFEKWIITPGTPEPNASSKLIFEDETSHSTVLNMPAFDLSVTALCTSKFELTVKKGSGDGIYSQGEKVEIKAMPKKVFDKWIVVEGNPTFGDIESSVTLLTMPGEDVVIEASYKEKFELEVIKGDGDGEYFEGAKVKITADKREDGFGRFDEWIVINGNPELDVGGSETMLEMPDEDVTVEATFIYTLVVTNGNGDADYKEGEVATITAGTPAPEKRFEEWISVIGNAIIGDPRNEVTTVTIQDMDSVVRAIYVDLVCGETEEARREAMLKLFRDVSGSTVDQGGTPQSLAAEWMIEVDELKLCPADNDKKLLQRYAMAVFYYSTEGDNWIECFAGDQICGDGSSGKTDNDFEGQKAYLDPVNECDWAGNTCNDDLCITKIVFEEDNNAAGTVPMEFIVIDTLEVLSLEAQVIGGTIPSEYGQIETLKVIDFDFNQMTGSIPTEIYQLSNLEQLDLNDNQFTGSLTADIGGLESLDFLQLHNNKFTGTFPSELATIPVVVAEFFNNDFTGIMPLCIGANGQDIEVISVDCAGANPQVTCGADCGCECF